MRGPTRAATTEDNMTSPLRTKENTPREMPNSEVRGFRKTLKVLDRAKDEPR